MSIQPSSNLVKSDSLDESQFLRQELKDWEKAFEASNGGHKASREDIKNHPEIARKYKLYNKLRTLSPHHPSKSSPAAKTKSLPSAAPTSTTQTPQKHTKHSHYVHPSTLDPYDAPLSARKVTPSIFRTSIGPTPQKDGWVLGIFDFLSPESDKTGTPSKNQGRNSLKSIPGNSLKTPSKKKRAQNEEDEANAPSSKRVKPSPPAMPFTPSAARRTTTAAATPSHRKLVGLDDTPAFLKRSSAHPLNDDTGAPISWSPEINVRMRTKPALKGLSQLVRGLREMADKELDDEMDLLREIEGDGGAPKKSSFAAKLKAATEKKVDQDLKTPSSVPTLVQDSQTSGPEQQQQQTPRFPKLLSSSTSIEMPLGPDRALDDESEEDSVPSQRGRDGKPLRAFKKRGQKRSTRMSKMRPSKAKWKPEPAWKLGSGDEAEKGKDRGMEEEKGVVAEVQVVEETQLPISAPALDVIDDDDDMLKTDNEEFIDSCPSSASDEDEEFLLKSTSKRPKPNINKEKIIDKNASNLSTTKTTTSNTSTKIITTTTSSTQPPNKKTEPNKTKKKDKKKIAPTAHANFRALKIRGKGGAGGKGGKKYSRSRGRR